MPHLSGTRTNVIMKNAHLAKAFGVEGGAHSERETSPPPRDVNTDPRQPTIILTSQGEEVTTPQALAA